MSPPDTGKRFRVAFSFAREKREFVGKVARILADRFGEAAILHDKYHEAEFARWDLGMYLPKLYGEESELIVPVLCPAYDEKRWTGWEWPHIYSLLTKNDGHRVMPCRFEYAKADGLSPASGFIELDQKTPEQFATLILQRIALNAGLPKNNHAKPDPSLPLSAACGTPALHNLPALQLFFGREEELETIGDLLSAGSPAWGCLITGPGGMGKTSLAIRAAHAAPPGLFERIVFVSLKARDLDDDGERDLSGFLLSGLSELLNEIARELGRSEIVEAAGERRPRLLVEALRGTKTLLLLDNLESLTKRERDIVLTFVSRLPPGCKAILTARGRIGSGTSELILDKLDQQAALATLAELSTHNPHITRTSEAERLALYQETDGKPLLLRWTAGQLGRGHCLTPSDALRFLRSCPPGNDPLDFVFGDLLDGFDSEETGVLCLLTHFNLPVSVEHVAFVMNLRMPEVDRVLRKLAARSLIIPNGKFDRFTPVPLIPEFLRKWRTETVEGTATLLEQSAYALIMEHGHKNFHDFTILETAWPLIAPALPILLFGDNQRLQTACSALQFVFNYLGRWDEGLSFFSRAESRAESAGDHLGAGWRAYDVGFLHGRRGDIEALLRSAENADRHWEAAQAGAEVKAVAHGLRGQAHLSRGDFPAAAGAYRAALDLKRTVAVNTRSVAIALNDLAGAEQLSGNFTVARDLYTEALQIVRLTGDEDSVANFISNLAGLATAAGDWTTAESLSREALGSSESINRLELVAKNQACLAKALVEQGQFAESLALARSAVETLSLLGSPDVAYAKTVLGQSEAESSKSAG